MLTVRRGWRWWPVGASLMLAGCDVNPELQLDSAAEVQAASKVRIQRVVSANGIEAWLVEESAIPFVAIEIGFAGGAYLDPEGQAGRGSLMASLLGEGAGEYDAKSFRRELDRTALRVRAGIDSDRLFVSAAMLSRSRERSLELLRLFINEPKFEIESFERNRRQFVAELEQDLKDPNRAAILEWYRLAWSGDPYGRPIGGTPESVGQLTREDMLAAYDAQVRAGRMHIGVVGDITAAELAPILDNLLGDLPAGAYSPPPPAPDPAARGLAVLDFDVPQSTVRFGHVGILRDDPDYIPAYVLNYLLGGGGFQSRLNAAIRQDRGLAYSAYAYLYPFDRAGLVLGGLSTDNARVAEAVELVRGEWQRMYEDGVTEEELDSAKRYLTGAYPLRFDSNGKIANWLVGAQFAGLGMDYIERRNALVEAVTLADLARVAKRILKPDDLLFVVAGRPDGVDTDLR